MQTLQPVRRYPVSRRFGIYRFGIRRVHHSGAGSREPGAGSRRRHGPEGRTAVRPKTWIQTLMVGPTTPQHERGPESRSGLSWERGHEPGSDGDAGVTSSEQLEEALRNASGDISVSSTLPPACYTGVDVLSAETTGLLRRSWLGVARADEWKEPGDYRVLEPAGTSIIAVRDEEGRLRAFANTCRHRGTRLLEGSGNAARIRCPFHGWTYGLDGSLRGATRMGATQGFRRADMGLVEFRAAERGGFVFVALSGEAPGIDEWLGDFDALHAPWRLEELVTTRRRELEVDCNWKLFLEVFNESYHLEYVHSANLRGHLPGAGAARRGGRLRTFVLQPHRGHRRAQGGRAGPRPARHAGPECARAVRALGTPGYSRRLPLPPAARHSGPTAHGRSHPAAAGLPSGCASRPGPSPPPTSRRRRSATTRAWTRRLRRMSRCWSVNSSAWARPSPGRAAGRTWSAGPPRSRRGTRGAWRNEPALCLCFRGCRRRASAKYRGQGGSTVGRSSAIHCAMPPGTSKTYR